MPVSSAGDQVRRTRPEKPRRRVQRRPGRAARAGQSEARGILGQGVVLWAGGLSGRAIHVCGLCGDSGRGGAAPGWKQNGSNGSCGTRRRILWGLVPARGHMARAEMRIRVSIFFDPPRVRFQGGSARVQTQCEHDSNGRPARCGPRLARDEGCCLLDWLRVPSQAYLCAGFLVGNWSPPL